MAGVPAVGDGVVGGGKAVAVAGEGLPAAAEAAGEACTDAAADGCGETAGAGETAVGAGLAAGAAVGGAVVWLAVLLQAAIAATPSTANAARIRTISRLMHCPYHQPSPDSA